MTTDPPPTALISCVLINQNLFLAHPKLSYKQRKIKSRASFHCDAVQEYIRVVSSLKVIIQKQQDRQFLPFRYLLNIFSDKTVLRSVFVKQVLLLTIPLGTKSVIAKLKKNIYKFIYLFIK